MLNLIINAVDAIGEGSGNIGIRLYKTIAVEGQTEFVVEVADTGCGIQKADLKKIFVPFYTIKKTGTGLGLIAVKRIVRAHSGYWNVQSFFHQGSVFSLHLPAFNDEI